MVPREMLHWSSGGGALTLSSADTYSSRRDDDQLRHAHARHAAALGTGGLTMTGGTLDLNANSITVASSNGTAGTITDGMADGGHEHVDG